MNEAPVYVCHKEVRALKIAQVEILDDGKLFITPEDLSFDPFEAHGDDRPQPAVGWYAVLYDNGYVSFSPASAFEAGYTLKAAA